jgi:hypothetical protein
VLKRSLTPPTNELLYRNGGMLKPIIKMTVAVRSGKSRSSAVTVIEVVVCIAFVFVPVIVGLNSVELERILGILRKVLS